MVVVFDSDNTSRYEVISSVLDLLPTIDHALDHMLSQLDELRLEEFGILFKDTATAVGHIARALLLH